MVENTDIDSVGLAGLSVRAYVLGKAYQLRRESLWWSNLATLVLPAVLSTIVAIISALSDKMEVNILGLPLAAVLAGTAAILIAVHKILKCEEYQAECLRLAGVFQSIAADAEFAVQSSRNSNQELSRLSEKLTREIEQATATVPDKYIARAKDVAAADGYV